MSENRDVKRLKRDIDESLDYYYKNNKRLAIYIVVNNYTADLMVTYFGGVNVDDFNTIYYQNYKIAIDSSLKDF